jgi:hypothetical protein
VFWFHPSFVVCHHAPLSPSSFTCHFLFCFFQRGPPPFCLWQAFL